MMRISLAAWTFFRILFNGSFSRRVEALYLEEAKLIEPQPASAPIPPAPVAPTQPKPRSDALTLMALLQREGRLVDFLKEPLDSYSDAQIGAAVRDIHRDCSAIVERVFEIKQLDATPEGSEVTVSDGFDPERYRFTGNVVGKPPYRGVLRHHGWVAQKCDLPQWQGAEGTARVLAPAEVEVG